MWDNIEKVVLAKSSPFLVYSTDVGCRKGSAPDKLLEKTDISVSKSDGLQVGYETELSSDQIRKSWEIRGGTILSQEANFSLTSMTASSDGMKMRGLGYGMNGALNLISLSPPVYPDKPDCTIGKLGANFGFNNMFMKIDFPSTPGTSIKLTRSSFSNIVLGLNIGLQESMGTFVDSKTWNGVALGFAWRPTYQYSKYNFEMTTTTSIAGHTYYNYSKMDDRDSQLNMKGFEIYFDFVDLNAITSRFVKPAHFKVNFFFLPAIGDMKMTFIQIGLGVISY